MVEELGYEFTGEGEHLMVHIRKTGENTQYVANELAKACGVSSREVSWAGLKDRHAVTEQWLSVHLPGQADPDLSEFVATHPGVEVLALRRHNKKLRPGDLQGNRFELRVTELDAKEDLDARLSQIRDLGVPNYFGEQRFGHDGNNVTQAVRWGAGEIRVRDKKKRSFYLSAARSHLFNEVLSARLIADMNLAPMTGDLLIDAQGQTQAWQGEMPADWLLSGPMAGDNALPTQADAQAFEQAILDQYPELLQVLRDNRMRQERRSLLLYPQAMQWSWQEGDLLVAFALPAGAYATTVMRELAQLTSEDGRAYSAE